MTSLDLARRGRASRRSGGPRSPGARAGARRSRAAAPSGRRRRRTPRGPSRRAATIVEAVGRDVHDAHRDRDAGTAAQQLAHAAGCHLVSVTGGEPRARPGSVGRIAAQAGRRQERRAMRTSPVGRRDVRCCPYAVVLAAGPAAARPGARARLRAQLRHGLGARPRAAPGRLGLGSGLPRAVPSDAVVAVLDQVVPGVLLQKVVLLGGLVGGRRRGAAARCRTAVAGPPGRRRRVVAVEPVRGRAAGDGPLAGAGRLRRAALGGGRGPRRCRATARCRARCWCWCRSAASAPARDWPRRCWSWPPASPRHPRGRRELLGLLAAANAPWLVAGLLHAGAATTDPPAARLFALAGEGPLPGPLAALDPRRHLERRGRAGVAGGAGRLAVVLLVGCWRRRRPPAGGARPAARGAGRWSSAGPWAGGSRS